MGHGEAPPGWVLGSAFLRSQRWEPETWCDPVPSRAVIAKTLDAPDQTLAALTAYHGNRYREKLYR